MANPVKNQHYVPQFYLREFAESNEQLYVYDKRTDKIFPTHVKNVAHESYFYDIPKGWGDSTINRQVYEKKLSGIEAVYKRVLAVVLNHEGSGSLDFEAAWGLADMLRTQFIRTRAARNLVHELQTKVMQDLVDDLVERNFPEVSEDAKPTIEVDERNAAMLMCEKILDAESLKAFVEGLMGRFWTIWHNRTATPFITSDHPVSFAATSFAVRNFGVAPCVPFGVEVAFPLSPIRLLTVGDPPNIQRPNCSIVFADDDRVAKCNKMQLYSSHRHVFGREDDCEAARALCNENSSLRSPDDDRVRVTSRKETGTTETMVFVVPRYMPLD
jgi:Protein of unknown function (DUF4238)